MSALSDRAYGPYNPDWANKCVTLINKYTSGLPEWLEQYRLTAKTWGGFIDPDKCLTCDYPGRTLPRGFDLRAHEYQHMVRRDYSLMILWHCDAGYADYRVTPIPGEPNYHIVITADYKKRVHAHYWRRFVNDGDDDYGPLDHAD